MEIFMVRAARAAKGPAKKKVVEEATGIAVTSLRLEAQLKAELEVAAKADDRTFASLVTKILRDWVKANRA
jgi:hypothetical protein